MCPWPKIGLLMPRASHAGGTCRATLGLQLGLHSCMHQRGHDISRHAAHARSVVPSNCKLHPCEAATFMAKLRHTGSMHLTLRHSVHAIKDGVARARRGQRGSAQCQTAASCRSCPADSSTRNARARVRTARTAPHRAVSTQRLAHAAVAMASCMRMGAHAMPTSRSTAPHACVVRLLCTGRG